MNTAILVLGQGFDNWIEGIILLLIIGGSVLAPIAFGSNLHGYFAPVLPAFFFSTSPV